MLPVAAPCKDSQCGQLCLPRGSDNFTCSCGLGFVLSGRSECDVGTYVAVVSGGFGDVLVCVCVCACVRACVRACVSVCVRVRV